MRIVGGILEREGRAKLFQSSCASCGALHSLAHRLCVQGAGTRQGHEGGALQMHHVP